MGKKSLSGIKPANGIKTVIWDKNRHMGYKPSNEMEIAKWDKNRQMG